MADEVIVNGETLVPKTPQKENENIDPTLLAMLESPIKEKEPELVVKKEETKLKLDEDGNVIVDKDGKPGPGHERFQDVYRGREDAKRETEEIKSELAELKAQNELLLKSVNSVTDTHFDNNRPDPVENPKEFADWTYEKVKRDLERKTAEDNNKKKEDKPNYEAPNYDRPREKEINDLAKIQRGIHSDYQKVVAITDADIANDPVLRAEIMSSENPPMAAYEHGKNRIERMTAEKKGNINKGYVEGSSFTPDKTSDDKLTEDEKQMATNLGLDHKEYLKHRNIINDKRRA